MTRLLARMEKTKDFWFLLFTSIIFFIFRLPSFFEPYWYGDEGIYEAIGIAMQNGKLLYRDIWDNKPPLLYALYALFSSDQFLIRVTSFIFGLVSVIVFFLLIKKLFSVSNFNDFHKKNLIIYLATFTFAFFLAIPLLEGNIANSENFMMPLILISGLLIFQNKTKNFLIISGLLLSFAFLFKTVAIFDFAAFLLFLTIVSYKDKRLIIEQVKNLLPFVISFVIPIAITGLFFLLNGAFLDFFIAVFMQNVGYVGYGNKFIIPQGFLILKLIILASIVLVLFIKRHRISETSLFILLWLSFSIFNAFFSQRPYTHYVLVVFPSLMLFLAFILLKNSSLDEKKTQKRIINLGLVTVFALILLITNSFNFYKKTLNYYQNFISFINGTKDVYFYRGFFDWNTARDYEIAQYINAHSSTEDKIFIWGDNAQLYVLLSKLPPGRFTVAYHITARKEYIDETYKAIVKEKPKYIIITSNNPIIYPLNNYRYKLNIRNSLIYERIF